MRIKRLEIDGEETVGGARDGAVTAVCPDPGIAVRAVCSVLLLSPTLKIAPLRAKIRAEVAAGGREYLVRAGPRSFSVADPSDGGDRTDEYRALMSRSPEEDRILLFGGDEGNALARYMNEDRFFKPGELSRVTCGMGATRTFRDCLRDYTENRSLLTDDERDPLLSFLDAARFWDEFGRIRDFRYEGKPLLVRDADAETADRLVRLAGETDRQILILTRVQGIEKTKE